MVLNKIDTLWDELTPQEQVQAQTPGQCRRRAVAGRAAGSGRGGVGAKGRATKIRCDDDLLQASGLPQLEVILGTGIMGRRQAILRATVGSGVASLRPRYGACSISAGATLTSRCWSCAACAARMLR